MLKDTSDVLAAVQLLRLQKPQLVVIHGRNAGRSRRSESTCLSTYTTSHVSEAAALGFSVKVTRVHFWTATGLPGGSCPSHYASRALFPLELVTDKEDLGDPHAHLFCLLNQPPPLPPCEEVAPRMIRVDAHVYPATG